MSQDMSEIMSGDLSENMPEDWTERMSQDMSERLPEEMSARTSALRRKSLKDVSASRSEHVPRERQKGCLKGTEKYVSSNVRRCGRKMQGGGWEFWGGLGSLAGWRTAGLNLLKMTRPRLANGMELQGRVLVVLGVLQSFAGWQTAALNLHKKTRRRPQGLVGAARKVCRGLNSVQNTSCGLSRCQDWQTSKGEQESKFHTCGGPTRRPGHGQGRGRRIFS